MASEMFWVVGGGGGGVRAGTNLSVTSSVSMTVTSPREGGRRFRFTARSLRAGKIQNGPVAHDCGGIRTARTR